MLFPGKWSMASRATKKASGVGEEPRPRARLLCVNKSTARNAVRADAKDHQSSVIHPSCTVLVIVVVCSAFRNLSFLWPTWFGFIWRQVKEAASRRIERGRNTDSLCHRNLLCPCLSYFIIILGNGEPNLATKFGKKGLFGFEIVLQHHRNMQAMVP